MSFCERTVSLIGQEKYDILKTKNVIVFGCGGVGGYVIEMLARTGVENLTIVDFDRVSESNLNRQIIATTDTIGKLKTECFVERIEKINSTCKVLAISQKLSPENIEEFYIEKYDYVVDCIDDVKAKVELIKHCYERNIKIISSMGAGNRFDVPNFEICDIYDTKNDGLAKALRSRLKKLGVKKSNVVATTSLPKKLEIVGSIAYYPASCGITISSFVINDLIK